jgi:cytochrome c-type biogenesis protein CcmF
MEIQYSGEQLFFGHAGNLFIALAFTSALLAAVAYFISLRSPDRSWIRMARTAFGVHSFSVLSVLGILFYLILNHRFEYYYVWEHSSYAMPLRYIFSCFWEGQEGSFLLWIFWHVVLSWIIIRKSGEWEGPVMGIICTVQVFLASMVLGVVVLGHKIGSNPLVLLREHPDFANLPFIKMPDYLSRIRDGRGLNPLLQNYWMTIHPPTLFLGFASTVVPFAFAMGGLLRRKYSEWVAPALPWTFFGIMILGTGILMGAAWAYESLSFGGFWAWDPVENASLVPWMTLVGAGHVMLIYKHRKHSLLSAVVLCVVTFLLILYSTFLTRSGILGDASVHAFTDLGMSGQLVIYMAFFTVAAIVLLVMNRKQLRSAQPEEEQTLSREFWMFIGMMVLVLGSLQITFTTSIPVINKLFGTSLAPPADAIDHYNKWQIPVAVVISLLIGAGQFFKYRHTESRTLIRRLLVPLGIAALVTAAAAFVIGEFRVHYYVLFFASVFAIAANTDYFFTTIKGRWNHAGASIAHTGFGLILLGALLANGKKDVISRNVKNVNLGKNFPSGENIMIEQGTDTLPMGPYYVTYRGREKSGINLLFHIDYFVMNKETGKKEKAFELSPILQLNERMGNVAEPATKRFLTRDIYTHLTYAQVEDESGDPGNPYQPPKTQTMAIGDTFITSNSFVVLKGLNKDVDRTALGLGVNDLAVAAVLEAEDVNRRKYEVQPLFIIRNMSLLSQPAVIDTLGLKFEFERIHTETGQLDISVSEKKSNRKEFIIMKAIIFPGINLLWTGCILLIIGSVLAVRHRIAGLKRKPE